VQVVLLYIVVLSMASHFALSGLGTHGWRAPMDCLRASEVCNQNSQCSSRFRIMRQCLVGRDRTTMLGNRECQAALEVLQDSPLYDCRCKRGMKRELQCLQSYWSIHMGLNEGKAEFLILKFFSVPSRTETNLFPCFSIRILILCPWFN
uniref:GDNF family receptor alpha 2b n=1 Tax=Sinocyclocheilus grahami TaxID=75366 RepID=A0A672L348_SINGR